MKSLLLKTAALGMTILFCLLSTACSSTEDEYSSCPPAQSGAQETAEVNYPPAPAPGENINYAPDFTVLDKDGNTVKLSDFRGKPVVLNFWATWCPPCKQELPDFNQAAETYKDEIVFLMVNLTDGQRDTVDSVKVFVADNGYTFPVYFDTAYSAASAYRIESIPTTYFINAKGEAVNYKIGMMTAAELESGIRDMIG